MTPAKWEQLLKRLKHQQTVQTAADMKRIRGNVTRLKSEIKAAMGTWDALAAQGDRTGLMMAGHLRRMVDNLDRIMGNASQAVNHDLEGSWQKWWNLGTTSTRQMAAAAGLGATELAIQGEKLDLYRHYIPDLIQAVGTQTKTKMANYVRQAALAGTPRVEVQRGMLQMLLGEPARYDRGRFGGWAYQVERIYRTESQRLYNMAAVNAAEALVEKTGADLVKIWNHPGADETAREDHVEMDGEFVEINEPFSNGLMYPKDPAGAAEDTINCRCWVSFMPYEDAAAMRDGTEPAPEPVPEPVPETEPAPEPAPEPGSEEALTADLLLQAVQKDAAAEWAAFKAAQEAEEQAFEVLKETSKAYEASKKAGKYGGEEAVAQLRASAAHADAITKRVYYQEALEKTAQETLLERFGSKAGKLEVKFDEPTSLKTWTDKQVRAVETARDFVAKMAGRDLGEVKMYHTTRASSYYMGRFPGNPVDELGVYLSSQTPNAIKSTVHELGHMIEDRVAGLHDKILKFYNTRTANEKLQAHPDGWSWKPDKWGKVSKRSEYAGRWYESDLAGPQYATEILSIGLELMLQSPATFAMRDPEYFNFIMGLLKGMR